jgi:hypothetical protein
MRQVAGDIGACLVPHTTELQLSNLTCCPHLLQVLPIDVAKSRLQVARPGSQCDMSLLQNLRLLHQERARLHTSLRSLSYAGRLHIYRADEQRIQLLL